jgi:hypothetical protein
VAATLYSARLIGPEIIEAGMDNVVTCPVYRDGALVVPTVYTLTVWNSANVHRGSAYGVGRVERGHRHHHLGEPFGADQR